MSKKVDKIMVEEWVRSNWKNGISENVIEKGAKKRLKEQSKKWSING